MVRGMWTAATAALFMTGAFAQQTCDGTADWRYNGPQVIQNVQTSFGDNFSELNVGYAYIADGNLNLVLAGNLENNGNKLNVFIDSVDGGQNRLRGDNWKDTIGNSWYLTRLGDSGGPNGFTFESGFTADYFFGLNRSGGNLFVDFSATPDTANNLGYYLGQSNLTDGNLSGGNNLIGVKANYNGANTAGVSGGTGTGYGLGGVVNTGVELVIPLSAIGFPSGPIRIVAFVASSDNSFLSNQFLPGVGYNGGTVGSYGEPRGQNLGGTGANSGTQFFLAPVNGNGNIVVSRISTTSTFVSNQAYQVNVDEYTTGGTLVQTLAMPTTTSGANYRLTMTQSATSEGFLTRSTDGRYLTIAGYDAAIGTGSLPTTSSIARVLGRVAANGAIDTRTGQAFGTATNPRSAVTFDGDKLWLAYATQGSYYFPLAGGAGVQVNSSALNSRVANIFNNQLYVSIAANISAVGAGLPENSSGVPTLGLTGVLSGYDFYFANANTLYVADDGASTGIRKFTYNGATWTARYTINSGLTGSNATRALAGVWTSDTNVRLYTVHSDNTVRWVDDNPTLTSNPNNPFTTIATGNSTNTFRGVEFSIFPANTAPTLTVPANATINEFQSYSASATATDPDAGQTLTFSKVAGPAALTVSAGGAIAWTPGELDGGGSYTVTVQVTDNGSPPLSDTKSFTISVNETNQAPTLDDPADGSVDELVAISRTLVGADADLPAQTLTYSLVSGPGSVTGNTWSWTPGEADGPGTYTVTVQVSDGTASAQQSFDVTVNEVNQAPTLDDPADGTVDELQPRFRPWLGDRRRLVLDPG